MAQIKIALVDDEQLFRLGLETMLSPLDDVKIIGSFENGLVFTEHLRNSPKDHHPEIVILDLKMAEKDGVETAEEINLDFPHIKIIVLSTYHNKNFVGYIFKLGVNAFLPKTIDRDELATAMRQVHTSDIYLTPSDNLNILDYLKNPKPPSNSFNQLDTLSSREKEILQLICAQKTNKEIADNLFISKRTVDGHRIKLMEKTGARNTAGLVMFAILNRIVSLDQFKLHSEIVLDK